MERLVVSVDVEKDGGQDTCGTLIVQFDIKPPTGQQIMHYYT